MNPGMRIITDFKRPDPALIAQFKELPVANIDDNMGRIAAVHCSIRPLNKNLLCGPAFTVRVPQGDNLMMHKAMDMCKPGDILVIDAGGFDDRSIFGALMANYCAVRGIAGIVVDGSVRDADELRELSIPIWAKGITPNGPYKNGPGEINVPVVIGGKIVNPGDILVGDGDGLIVIKPEEAEFALVATKATMEKEADIMKHIVEDHTYMRPWVDEKLKELGYEL